MQLQYSMYRFATREEAREWLRAGEFNPVHLPGLMGVWRDADGQYVEAFKNQAHGWTVAQWREPNPDNYICE
jgi:hypothetical protein